MITASIEKAPALRGYLSIGVITLECGGQVFSDIGWAIFEVSDSNQRDVQGIISTYNDFATHVLVRLARAGRSCRLSGLFQDGKAGEYRWTLNDVVIETMMVQDTTATVGFRAVACKPA